MNRNNSQMEIGMKTYLQGQGGDARQINYRTHTNIELAIGDLPSHPTPDVQSFLRRQWACNLSRISEEAWLPSQHFFAAAMAKHHVPEAEQNLLRSVMIYTKHSDYLPVGAPEITARTVAKIGEEIQPPPLVRKERGRLSESLASNIAHGGKRTSVCLRNRTDGRCVRSRKQKHRHTVSQCCEKARTYQSFTRGYRTANWR